MHTLGKVLLWLNVVGAVGACVLTAKLFDVRNSWTEKVEKAQEQVAANEITLAENEAEYQRLQSELHGLTLGWGKSWPRVLAGVGQTVQGGINNQGQLLVQVGRLQGLGTPGAGAGAVADPNVPTPLPIVHAFATSNNGLQSKYVGVFQAIQIDDNQAQFEPLWNVEAVDLAGLQNSREWRLRTEIPARFSSELTKLRTDRITAIRSLQEKSRQLQSQIGQEDDAKTILQNRIDQLEGKDDDPGLVARLAAEEDERNKELLELDAIRRQIKQADNDIASLVEQLEQLEQQVASNAGVAESN